MSSTGTTYHYICDAEHHHVMASRTPLTHCPAFVLGIRCPGVPQLTDAAGRKKSTTTLQSVEAEATVRLPPD